YGSQEAITNFAVIETIKAIHDDGGIASLAHANSSKGVLKDMAGQQRINVIRCPILIAAEGTDFQEADKIIRRTRAVDYLDGTDPSYKRRLAVYQASDNPAGDASGEHGLAGIGTRCAYFKLERIDLSGLRQCFFDP